MVRNPLYSASATFIKLKVDVGGLITRFIENIPITNIVNCILPRGAHLAYDDKQLHVYFLFSDLLS